GAHPRTGGTVGLAVVVVLDLDFLPGIHAIDAEQAEAQALHAVGAAVVVDDGEPRLPIAVFGGARLAAGGLSRVGNAGGVQAGDVLETHGDVAGGFGLRRAS